MGGDNNIFTKVAGHRNWNWVAEYHSEASLIDAVLRFGLRYLFLSWVSGERVFKLGVGAEARADLMDMFSFKSLLAETLRQIKLNLLSRLYKT